MYVLPPINMMWVFGSLCFFNFILQRLWNMLCSSCWRIWSDCYGGFPRIKWIFTV